MKKVTIVDIAKKAGVSVTSVSFAFNNPNRLPEGTVQRILEIAEEIGYVPDPIARSMSTGKTGVIGLLVPQPISEIIRNPFLSEFIEGVGEISIREGLSILLVPPLEGSVKRAVARTAVDGFITIGLELYKSTIAILRRRGVAFVMVDTDTVENISSVNIQDRKGAYLIMKHILEQGHREIGILGIRSGKEQKINEYSGTLRDRIAGYQDALFEYGFHINEKQIHLTESSSTHKGGIDGYKHLKKIMPEITCMVTMSDVIAYGVMEAVKSEGLNIPDDISIVGFDDIPYSKLVSPPLTTVSQPIRKKGRLAAEILIQNINGNKKIVHEVLPVKLLIRDSVSHPKQYGH